MRETNGKDEVACDIVHGGPLRPRKGLNLPETEVSLPCITEKDAEDLAFALEKEVDWIGLSFVRRASDIVELQKEIKKAGKHARVVAKIEKPEAIEDLDAILEATDAVMVARGDLGVEMPMQEVPLLQKKIVRKCMAMGKPVIVATQMLESMIESATPTRAEVNDVANAVLDGADAVMLSGETSVGKYPINAVRAMRQVIENIEAQGDVKYPERPPLSPDDDRFRGTLAAVEEGLRRGSHMLRYATEDDFGLPETAFNVCTFWLIEALHFTGRDADARALFAEMLERRTAAGLLSEDIDPVSGELWGNYPQTYSLVGMINCAVLLSKPWSAIR